MKASITFSLGFFFGCYNLWVSIKKIPSMIFNSSAFQRSYKSIICFFTLLSICFGHAKGRRINTVGDSLVNKSFVKRKSSDNIVANASVVQHNIQAPIIVYVPFSINESRSPPISEEIHWHSKIYSFLTEYWFFVVVFFLLTYKMLFQLIIFLLNMIKENCTKFVSWLPERVQEDFWKFIQDVRKFFNDVFKKN